MTVHPTPGLTAAATAVPVCAGAHERGRSGLAVVALIAAFFLSPLGLVLGFLAHRKVQKTGQKGARLAVAAMIVGGVFLTYDLLVGGGLPWV